MTRRLALATPLALVAISATAVAGGPGQTVEIDSRIKIRQSFPAFHGKVKSDNMACVQQRRAKLFKQKRNGDKKLLGFDRTNAEGKWKVIVDPLKSGVYYAVVKRREEGTAGTTFVCLRDKSRTD
jgi:hypothetical protein